MESFWRHVGVRFNRRSSAVRSCPQPVQRLGLVQCKFCLCHTGSLRRGQWGDALSWLWPKLRETTVLGNFVFATTIDNLLLLTVSFGWNDGALPEDLATVESFMPLYTRKVVQLGYTCKLLSPLIQSQKATPTKRKYGPRGDTLLKLHELVSYRRQNITPNRVEITLKQACEDKDLAMATVKKYAPILCERWYDQRYAGDVH